jgi:hypothetical protein
MNEEIRGWRLSSTSDDWFETCTFSKLMDRIAPMSEIEVYSSVGGDVIVSKDENGRFIFAPELVDLIYEGFN